MDDPHDPGELLPRPDPSRLTTEQLRRELSALREILTARLDAMDTATELLSETVNRTPTEIQSRVAHLKELLEARFDAMEKISVTRLAGIEEHFTETRLRLDDQFESIALQFAARDDKVEALAITAAASLKSALESAEKLSEANNAAALLANAKTEAAFAEQIKALSDKIEVSTRRLDRGEGGTQGAASYRTEHRLDLGSVIAAIAVIVAVISVIVVTLKH